MYLEGIVPSAFNNKAPLMAWKKRRVMSCDSMDAEKAKAKLAAAAEELGREIRIFTNSVTSSEETPASSISQNDEPDDFYEFSPEDYYRTISNKMGAQFLKTRKIREKEAAAHRAKITKAVIRVRFPDNFILEAKFHPSETIQSLMDLIEKVIARPDMPFYIFTTPPKERITDMSKDFYTAGFAPGAIVYFSYDMPKEADSAVASSRPFLRDDILSLNGLDFITEQADVIPSTVKPAVEPATVEPPPAEPQPKPMKKPTKPKWLKM